MIERPPLRRQPSVAAALLTAMAAVLLASCAGSGAPEAKATATTTTTTSTTTTTVASGVGTGSEGLAVEDEGFRGSGSTVALLGDSLTTSSVERLRSALRNRSVRITAFWGEGLSGGPFSTTFGSPLMLDAAKDMESTPPDVAVIALGTNDAWNPDLSLAAAETAWNQLMDDFSKSCIVAVTVTERSEPEHYDVAIARALNDKMRADADVIVDWAKLGSSKEFTGGDHIHPTPAGQKYYAELIRQGVDTCLSKR